MKARILAGVTAVTAGLSLGCSSTTDPTPALTISSSAAVSTSASPTAPGSTPTASLSPTPSPTPSESPTQVLDKDQEAARDVVLEYYRLRNLFGMDPTLMDITELTNITTGDAQLFAIEEIDYLRGSNLMATAPATAVVLSVAGVRQDAAGNTSIQVVGCVDASSVDVVDAQTGKSVVSPEDRRPVSMVDIDVIRSGASWLVNDERVTQTVACP